MGGLPRTRKSVGQPPPTILSGGKKGLLLPKGKGIGISHLKDDPVEKGHKEAISSEMRLRDLLRNSAEEKLESRRGTTCR